MAMTKVKKLQMWCKTIVDGYHDVSVTDMTSSWKDGLACCAIIHRFRPDLIDFDSLSKANVFENNQLAFEVAETELGIPALLEAEDMVAIRVPDRLSVVTYVSQYYNYFHNKPQLGGPGVRKAASLKRHQSPEDLSGPQPKRLTPQKENGDQKTEKKGSIGDKCTICHEKVYLMERLMESNKLYHRTCFRQSDLAPTSKIYARSNPGSPDQPSYWQQRSKGSEKSANLAARLNDLKKSTASPQPSVDLTKNKIDSSKNYTQQKPVLSDIGSQRTNVKGGEIGLSQGQLEETKSMDTSPSSTRVKSPVLPRVERPMSSWGKPLTPQGKSPGSPRSESPVSPRGKLKPRAVPRGSIKSKDDSKPVNNEKESVALPPRKKSPKSSPMSSGSPPPLPTSMPPSLAGGCPSLVPANIKGSSKEMHSSARSPSDTTTSPSKFKSPSNSESLKEISKPEKNLKTGRNVTTTPMNSQSLTDQNFKRNTVLSSNIQKQDPAVDNTPPQKPPRSLPRGTTPKDMEQAMRLSDHELVEPGTIRPQKDKNENVLKGLLKNLANIRDKDDGANVNSSNHRGKLADTTSKTTRANHIDRPTTDANHTDRPTTDANHTDCPTTDANHTDRPTTDASHTDQPKVPRVMRRAVIPPSKTETVKLTETNNTKIEPAKKNSEIKTGNEIKSESSDPPWKNHQLKKTKEDGKRCGDWRDEDKKYGGWKDEDKINKNVDRSADKKTKIERPARPKTPEIMSRKQVKGVVRSAENTQSGSHKSKENKRDVPTVGQKTVQESRTSPMEHYTLPETDKIGNKKKKIAVNIKFDFEETGIKEGSKSPPPRPPQPSPHDIKEPRRSIKKHKERSVPGSPGGWLKDGDFQKMSPLEIQTQLAHIDSKLTDLEVRGRHLEDSIRKAVEEDETMMMEWFQMVNEKNELVRREADLIYASRTQELEDEQQDIDRQIRELLEKPDGEKTEEERQEEELLLQKLIDVVNQRSIIVDSQDDDRIRYLEEDHDIAVVLESKGYAKKKDLKC
ncbi:MICAL-like protein 1 [Pecten maximus]|uniref:MICAL-like protein 1 n=1 Tax=Pecten maximus TaxID=6579 RepID=UPI001458C0C6|nr:MICAL-like protein 1 [Pecten maximus]